jgi:hypothetical protein
MKKLIFALTTAAMLSMGAWAQTLAPAAVAAATGKRHESGAQRRHARSVHHRNVRHARHRHHRAA